MDRRSILKQIGTIGVAGTGLMAGTTSGALQMSLSELQGQKKEKLLQDIKSSTDYTSFIEAIRTEGVDTSGAVEKVYKITPQKRGPKYISAFVFKGMEREQRAEIAIPIGETSRKSAKAIIIRDNSDGYPVNITTLSYGDGSETKDEENLAQKIITTPNGALVRAEHDLSSFWENISKETIGALEDYCSDEMEDMSCETCKEAVTLLNGIGCSAETAVICAVITAKTAIGPIVCAVAVGFFCIIILNYGITRPQDICELTCSCP